MEATFNLQGSPNQINIQGPEINRTHETHFSPPNTQTNFNIQGPEVNFNRSGPEANINFNGPSANFGSNNNEVSEMIPYGSDDLRSYIRRKPYTQRVEG